MTRFAGPPESKKRASHAPAVVVSLAQGLILGLALLGAPVPARADSVPTYDLGSLLPKTSLSPRLGKLVFSNSNAVSDDGNQELGAGLFDREPPSIATELTRFDEMVGHHIRWHYDDSWASSFGSDFPKVRTPTYLIGNGAPGVTQKIWFQFSISRSF